MEKERVSCGEGEIVVEMGGRERELWRRRESCGEGERELWRRRESSREGERVVEK